ncbi:MAG: DegT/DnrJ/EryC1/StrS family aminotransferase, partial [Candidatus Hinthialibacter sp.]
ESPMHPEKKDLSKFGYQLGSCPEAEKASREVINLPTHKKVSIKEAERVVNFLKNYASPI